MLHFMARFFLLTPQNNNESLSPRKNWFLMSKWTEKETICIFFFLLSFRLFWFCFWFCFTVSPTTTYLKMMMDKFAILNGEWWDATSRKRVQEKKERKTTGRIRKKKKTETKKGNGDEENRWERRKTNRMKTEMKIKKTTKQLQRRYSWCKEIKKYW